MADYGGFQIKRTVSLAPLTSVHEAVAVDGRAGRFALKVFHPPASSSVRRFLAVEGWLLAAERQQQAAKKDGAVVEVLALGRCEEGAFMALPWQERTLEPFIKTLHVKGDTLRALAECLFNAVEKWEAQAGGPHGNLKASNVFLGRGGPLAGMPAQLSDSAHTPGVTVEQRRMADLAGVGAMLATIVRRRPPGAWPIEDAPEWRALGKPGKAWLDFCNELLNPSPDGGPMALADARKKLRAVPKDSNPVKTAALIGLAAVVLLGASVVGFARFGDPDVMPGQLRKLAETVRNPRAYRQAVAEEWALLCRAWDSWLGELQNGAKRYDKNTALWAANDPLKAAMASFLTESDQLRPETIVPEAAGRGLLTLANSPPDNVRNELLKGSVDDAVKEAWRRVNRVALQLETWPRWEEMRNLAAMTQERGYARVTATLQPRLPLKRGSEGYKLDIARTLKLFNDFSLDDQGLLPMASRWSEITQLKDKMEAKGDRVLKAMPAIITGRLVDKGSLADFADSLVPPLEEMRRRLSQFDDPQVVSTRLVKESPLQLETAEVTEADFPRWEQELVAFSKVPAADDPRRVNTFEQSVQRMQGTSQDLEADAPAAEPGGLPTLSTADFSREFQEKRTELDTFRAREIVRRDLPQIAEETTKLAEKFTYLEQRIEATLALLKPEIWLEKVAQTYGKFNESKQRWAAWQATLTTATPDALRADKPRFRALRAQERQVKEWLDGLEGPAGFAALAVPDISTATADTSAELLRLESVRREQAASAVAAAAEWRNAVPAAPWSAASAAVRAPLDAHKNWLAALPQFASILDQLSEMLTAGFEWGEGVNDVVAALGRFGGVNDLAGRPAEWHSEAKQLEPLVDSSDRTALTAASQAGGLSRKLMAWRRLANVAGWPGGPEDFDFDRGVITVLRETVTRDVKDERRRNTLFEEMTAQTRARFNRAARTAASAETTLVAMFERMQPAGLTEADLEEPVAYNLALKNLKHSDWNEQNLEKLRVRRDEFVSAVRGRPGVAAQEPISRLLNELSGIELKDDPNRAATPSPRMFGWEEELNNDGLGLTAMKAVGDKKVSIDYFIVQPKEGDPTKPFYLATRAIAVGEFVDLLSANPRGGNAVKAELPNWSRTRPWNRPVSWDRNSKGDIIQNNDWFIVLGSQVQPLFDNPPPGMAQVVNEKLSARSPVQQVPPDAARIFAEQVLGARLPKIAEWQAVTKLYGKPADGYFRGQSFQKLWSFLENYREGGQVVDWRPNNSIFLPIMKGQGKFKDDGKASTVSDKGRLWMVPVDEGPVTDNKFINLFGNVWIYLQGQEKKTAKGEATFEYFVGGGSILSPPGVDVIEPQELKGSGLIGSLGASAKLIDGYADVGIRPAFDAPPGFRERYKFLMLVRGQKYLTL